MQTVVVLGLDDDSSLPVTDIRILDHLVERLVSILLLLSTCFVYFFESNIII